MTLLPSDSSFSNAPRIAGICGSLNPSSATRRALILALEGARRAGATTHLLDLRDFHLPFAESGFDLADFPDVERFNQLVRESDGLIWATPEYHGSFSGALKNALDLGSFPEYEGKMIALLGVAAGQIGAINALSHLRSVGRQLHAWVLPHQVSVARAYAAFDENGRLKDENLAASVEKLGAEVALWAARHAGTDNK
ncbi:FMN reductase [Abditibacterium utsteinense]|uniref:FMN reductase n=1 Tax=Abditibacterium utsteinense TaxID=1960156 RepID=A0A2S8SVS0_9BACT|nr:NAD(P)H-dependent oxidoreductase [Abditibacterium utsteinense]PQV64885.1 FMN reductase [Abditibacterium utsteinense]